MRVSAREYQKEEFKKFRLDYNSVECNKVLLIEIEDNSERYNTVESNPIARIKEDMKNQNNISSEPKRQNHVDVD